jgi:hypothetical protein
MIKWIRKLFSSENKPSYVYVVTHVRGSDVHQLAFRVNQEALDYVRELRDIDGHRHPGNVMFTPIQLI